MGRTSTLLTGNSRKRVGVLVFPSRPMTNVKVELLELFQPFCHCPVGSRKWASQVSEPRSVLRMNRLPKR